MDNPLGCARPPHHDRTMPGKRGLGHERPGATRIRSPNQSREAQSSVNAGEGSTAMTALIIILILVLLTGNLEFLALLLPFL